eukprot:4942035-Ditylum_brightwellii.AAC.1
MLQAVSVINNMLSRFHETKSKPVIFLKKHCATLTVAAILLKALEKVLVSFLLMHIWENEEKQGVLNTV